MKQVKIINGIYGHKPRGSWFVQPVRAGEVVDVADEEAARLIGLSVAIYTGASVRDPISAPVATPSEGANGGDPGEDLPEGGNGAACQDFVTLPENAATIDIVDGHFTVESLMALSRPNMEQLAMDLGLDVSKCKNKAELAALLTAVEVEPGDPEDGDTPPELGATSPVV